MRRRDLLALLPPVWQADPGLPDIYAVPTDLTVPPVAAGEPGAGRRVRMTLDRYRGTEVHHLLYLPTDWKPRRKYPVIVEYAGNGGYHNRFGDVSLGTVEGSSLGYGISGGKHFLWLCLPYVSADGKTNEIRWWGDLAATLAYAKEAVPLVCERFGGDASAVILSGFSRGAIACGFLGLHDDEIARLWCGFVASSHYDGVKQWPYAGSDRESALARLRRLNGRPSFICHEGSVATTRAYLESTGVKAPFEFVDLPYRNHTDTWVLRDIAERRRVRAWLRGVLAGRKRGNHSTV